MPGMYRPTSFASASRPKSRNRNICDGVKISLYDIIYKRKGELCCLLQTKHMNLYDIMYNKIELVNIHL